jgi:hypothetical protein
MNDEADERWLARYRSAAHDEPSASLDRAILVLAQRRAARVRTMRAGVVFSAMCLVVTVALVALSRHPGVPKASMMPGRTDYGLHEGATREYLLTVSAVPPGAIDWR